MLKTNYSQLMYNFGVASYNYSNNQSDENFAKFIELRKEVKKNIKDIGSFDVVRYLVGKRDVFVGDNFPTEMTEEEQGILYCPNGEVYYNGERVDFKDPSFKFRRIEYILPLRHIANEIQKDIFICSNIKEIVS